jgi:very-short-patch-repair endonuclease
MVSPPDGPVDVTVATRGGRRRRRGIRLHRSATLLPSDCTLRHAIPVTKPARTLDDLHRVLSAKEFAAALREAEYRRLPTGERFRPDGTRSELERSLLSLCRRFRLPQPEVNAYVDRFLVDFLWRADRLVVEVDGWAAHGTRSAFESDRARDARLKSLGYEVLRFTYRQVAGSPGTVAGLIRSLLSR